MARPERVVDPDAGPVESFAADLRSLRRRAGKPPYRVLAEQTGYSITTLSNAAGGRRLPSLPVALAFVRACGGDADDCERRWREVAATEATGRDGGAEEERDPPYRGLTGYGVADEDWFFGRRQMIAQLVEMLRRQRFLAVFGVSGSGKSSLLRAGLIPAMSRPRQVKGSGEDVSTSPVDGHVPVLLRPGSMPVASLRMALHGIPLGHQALVVVDQFEELFTLGAGPDERSAFVGELAALVADPADRSRVVLGVRADFYARCSELPELARLLSGGSVPVPPLSQDELKIVITGPARRAGLTVERALVTRVLADAAAQPGALPLVSHALLEAWRHRRGDVLAAADYEATGGVAGAIAHTAERLYGALDPVQQETARQVLLRLVTLGDGVPDTRRRAVRTELDLPEADTVLERMAAARLVVLGEDSAEIAHEALISAWPRLHGWLQGDRERLRQHRQLSDAAATWEALGRDPDALYRGSRLEAWTGRAMEQVNGREREFLIESLNREAREKRTRRRRIRTTMTGLVAGVVVTSVLAGLAVVQARRVAGERDLALSRQLTANARAQLQTDPELALLLARRAFDLRSTPESEAVLRQAVEDSRVRAAMNVRPIGVAYSPDKRRLAASGADGLRVWSLDTAGRPRGAPMLLPGPVGATYPVFGSDGRWVSVAHSDGTIRVWDLNRAGRAPSIQSIFCEPDRSAPSPRVIIADFSSGGQRAALVCGDDTVRIRDLAGRRDLRVLPASDKAWNVAFTADGQRPAAVAVIGEGPTRILSLPNFREIRRLPAAGPGSAGAFSPDGSRMALVGRGKVQIWTVAGSAPPLTLPGEAEARAPIAWSADGRTIATSSVDGGIHIHDVTGAAEPLMLRGHKGTVNHVAFSPDGRHLATAGGDGSLRIWDTTRPRTVRIAAGGPPGEADAVPVLTPDGRYVASPSTDGTILVSDTIRATRPTALRLPAESVTAMAFSRDGRRLVSLTGSGTVVYWDIQAAGTPDAHVAGPAARLKIGTTNPSGAESHMLAVSRDGMRIAVAFLDGIIRVWNLRKSGPPVVLSRHPGLAMGMAFSPDGHRLASVDSRGVVRVHRIRQQDSPWTGQVADCSYACPISFSSDGRHLATAGDDATIRIVDLAHPKPPVLLRGHVGEIPALAFTPDGQRLASAGADGTVRIWPTVGGEPLIFAHPRTSVTNLAYGPGDRIVTADSRGTLRHWHCAACGPLHHVRTLADTRITRTLTAEERRLFLNDPSPQ